MRVVQSIGKSVMHTCSTYWDHPVGNVSKLWHLHGSQDCYIDVTTTAAQNMEKKQKKSSNITTHYSSLQYAKLILQYARQKSPYSLVVKVSSQCAEGPGFDPSETLRLTLLQQPLRE